MSDLISREALGVDFCNPDVFENKAYAEGWNSLIKIIKAAPAVDAVSPGVFEQVKWERDTAIEQLNQLGCGFGMDLSAMLAKVLRKADAEPVRHGRWENTPFGIIKCTLCGSSYNIYKGFADYCPSCGARMDLEMDE